MKTCSKCHNTLELKFFSKDARNKDGFQNQCQVCRKAQKTAVNKARTGIVSVTSKTCNKCEQTKNAESFFKDRGISDGLSTVCKVCKTETTMAWREQHRDRYNENQRKQHAKNYLRNRLYRYDLTPEEYNNMLVAQDNKCAMCKTPPQGKRPLVIDHNHKTKAVRGLLCYGCNRALHVLETEELLKKAMDYLNKHK